MTPAPTAFKAVPGQDELSGIPRDLSFHPSRPVLAVLEPNGAQTRLGLWDFTAE